MEVEETKSVSQVEDAKKSLWGTAVALKGAADELRQRLGDVLKDQPPTTGDELKAEEIEHGVPLVNDLRTLSASYQKTYSVLQNILERCAL